MNRSRARERECWFSKKESYIKSNKKLLPDKVILLEIFLFEFFIRLFLKSQLKANLAKNY